MAERKRFLEKQLVHAEDKKLGRQQTRYEFTETGKMVVKHEARSARTSPRLVTLGAIPIGRKLGVKAP